MAVERGDAYGEALAAATGANLRLWLRDPRSLRRTEPGAAIVYVRSTALPVAQLRRSPTWAV